MELMQTDSDQLHHKSNETPSPLEDKQFSTNSSQIAAEQDFRILSDEDSEDLDKFVRILESLADELEVAAEGPSSCKRSTENEVPMPGCKDWIAHVSLDTKGYLMGNDIIQDEISDIQEGKEELHDKFQVHSIECIGSIPEKDNPSLKCSHCNKTYRSKESYQTHIRRIYGKGNHKCLYCNKGFHLRLDLEIHLKTHTVERPYKCALCEKTYARSGGLKRHIQTHTRERSFKCSLCEKAFTSKQNMSKHIRMHRTNL